MTPEQLAARVLADVDRIYPWAKHQPMMLEEDAIAAIARHLAPGDDLVEQVAKVRKQLQKDVFYGDERLHNMERHNPLHLEASVLLCNLLSRIAALTATVAAKENECEAKTKTIKGLVAVDELWRRNSRATYEAMVAMRNSINEHLPMPSLESDLLQGPENSVFCAAVAEAVVSEVSTLRARLARMEEESEGWKKAFAAQSNKLQKVLHIPGVRAALTESPADGT